MSDLHYWSIVQLSDALRRREISSVEVVSDLLARIAALDPKHNAYITVMAEQALNRASEADAAISRGVWRGLLHGVPLAAKDLFFTRDAPTTSGMKINKDFASEEDATVVSRLYQAGSLLMGKTNLTEGAHATQHPFYPVPINPFDDNYWVGASSHGSAVATALGLAFGALATDTGGSIRFPAACANITGIKPTWGRVSRHGTFPLGQSLDHVGPFARSVEDVAVLLAAMAGPDQRDPTALQAPVPDYLAATRRGLSGLTIGIDETYISVDAHPEVVAAVDAARRDLQNSGATIRKIVFPSQRDAILAWRDICGSEAAAFHSPTYLERSAEYHTGLTQLIQHGLGVSGTIVANAWKRRFEFGGRVAEAMKDVDLMLIPTLFTPVPTIAEVESFGIEDDVLVQMTRYTIPFNLTGLPALVLPGGVSSQNAPISIQLIGKHLSEEKMFAAGYAFQQMSDWHLRRPPV